MQSEILIIHPEAGQCDGLAETLAGDGYACQCAGSVSDAVASIGRARFDLAVLDATGGEDVDALAPLFHASDQLPVIAISARGDVERTARLLHIGACDYLTAPFDPRELAERIEIQLRRSAEEPDGRQLRYKELTLDPSSFRVTLCGQPLSLTRQEFRILELMLSSPPGRIFSKQDFFNYAWDGSYSVVDKTVNVHICNIRKKFRSFTESEYIETIWGFGFRLA